MFHLLRHHIVDLGQTFAPFLFFGSVKFSPKFSENVHLRLVWPRCQPVLFSSHISSQYFLYIQQIHVQSTQTQHINCTPSLFLSTTCFVHTYWPSSGGQWLHGQRTKTFLVRLISFVLYFSLFQ